MAGFRGTWGKGFAAVAAVCLFPGFLASFFIARPTSRYSRLSNCVRQDLGNLAGPVILLSVLLLGAFCFLCLRGAQRAIPAIRRFDFMLSESRVRRTRRPYVPYIRDDQAYTFGRPPRTFAPLSNRRKVRFTIVLFPVWTCWTSKVFAKAAAAADRSVPPSSERG
ncbi:hypothetical protein BDD12DRAFT_886892 [Trichophaea hybrida]|nr:hypothetical protein BDD12DRAFT_886892 [Trichophaea hybrida]